MSFSRNTILGCCLIVLVIVCIQAASITHHNESGISTATRSLETRTYRTTTAVVHHTSYTTVYIGVGVGCGCGGFLVLIILFCICSHD